MPSENYLFCSSKISSKNHSVKSVRIRSYSGPHFPTFGLNTERYSVSLRIQSKCGKMRTRITPNTDTFHAVNNRRYSEKVLKQVLWLTMMKMRLKMENRSQRCDISRPRPGHRHKYTRHKLCHSTMIVIFIKNT